MILPDHEIHKLGEAGMILPFTAGQVEPASYDVRLGYHFKIFQRDATPVIDLRDPVDITRDVHLGDDQFFLMHPGEFALGVTRERVHLPDNIVGRIEGKSSVGRLGLMIHITAGYIDPGFQGPITLELLCVHPLPVKIWPDEKIAQISFHEMKSPAASPYKGRYQGATTVESSKYGQKMS